MNLRMDLRLQLYSCPHLEMEYCLSVSLGTMVTTAAATTQPTTTRAERTVHSSCMMSCYADPVMRRYNDYRL